MNGLDKLVEELGGNFLLGGAVIQFSDATFTDAFKTIYEAGAAAEREACAEACNGAVGSASMYDSPDSAKFAYGVKNHCQELIRARGNNAA